ncbi:MAG: cytidine deaminase [Lentimicrobium sp.]|nr:cytidine deaminase [Lentimicrobium sp.]
MKHKTLKISYSVSESNSDLSEPDQFLMKEALKSAQNAYAPYSGFSVGAAIKLSSGKIVTGNNQENAAYPSGLCAERVALFSASALYPNDSVETIAITIKTKHKIIEPVAPCGACRQVIAEYENRQNKKIRIIFSGETGKSYMVEGIQNLLPITFNARNMNNR